MARVFYVHWHERECLDTVRLLQVAGHSVDCHWDMTQSAGLPKEAPPDAIVVSLARLPSHGRAVASAVVESKRLRHVPLLFVGGAPEKVIATQNLFPDAGYCSANELTDRLNSIPPLPSEPTVTEAVKGSAKSRTRSSLGASRGAGYSGTPLPQKLGIQSGHRLALVNAPTDFAHTLGELPADVDVVHAITGRRTFHVIVGFVSRSAELRKRFPSFVRRLEPTGGLWIAWPKKASGVATDLSEDRIRHLGLSLGLVDNKVCAVDEIWSGASLCLPRKRPANDTVKAIPSSSILGSHAVAKRFWVAPASRSLSAT